MRNGTMRTAAGLALLGALVLFSADQAGPRARLAPVNPAYLQALESPDLPLPSPQDLTPLRNTPRLIDETLPPAYDLRQFFRVSPVRSQDPYVNCPFFGIYGSLESTLKPLETLDFSEHHLDESSEASSILEANIGALARWADPVLEEDAPWPSAPLAVAALDPAKHVQNITFLPPRADAQDNDRIKRAIIDSGAVYAEMRFLPDLMNQTYSSYYNTTAESGLHAVAIIGWDDQFARTKFSPFAPGDGAFLCKNSRGTNFGNAGYFHVSYYDAFFARFSLPAVFFAEPAAGLTRNYQHDLVGCTARLGFDSETGWFASQFVSVSTDPLDAVALYSYSHEASYEIFVYKNATPGLPRSGAQAVRFEGTLKEAGYKTLRLPASLPMAVNEVFSVVVRLTSPGNNYPIPVEHPVEGFQAVFQAAPGESFISSDGADWSDLAMYEGTVYARSNVCLKAFAGFVPVHPPAYLRVDRLVNNLVFYKEYIDRLTWLPNPNNTGNIVAYRIYRKTKGEANSSYEFLAETGTTTLMYHVRGLQKDDAFAYRVTAVTDTGREGDPAEVTG
ncbi:MAG: hypothetical protein JW843_11555 [Candidatus Aminicenantes bacterium]|nr:hypothetical protein [Candidatus Aminicenantes bacterium]